MNLTDLGLTVSAIGFVVALIPAVVDSFRGSRTTVTLYASVPTVILLLNTMVWLAILEQSLAAAGTGLTAVMWALLVWRRL